MNLSDKICVITFVIFFFIAVLIDIVSVIAPTGGYYIDDNTNEAKIIYGVTKDNVKDFVYPPQFVYDAFIWWGQTCDELLLVNPLWLRMMAFLSPFIYAPLYVYFIYGFINGNNAIRIPVLIYASMMTHNLIILYGEALYGLIPSKNITIFTMGYGAYLLFPLYLLFRFRNPKPFGDKKKTH